METTLLSALWNLDGTEEEVVEIAIGNLVGSDPEWILTGNLKDEQPTTNWRA